jgi:hypothetical protein
MDIHLRKELAGLVHVEIVGTGTDRGGFASDSGSKGLRGRAFITFRFILVGFCHAAKRSCA